MFLDLSSILAALPPLDILPSSLKIKRKMILLPLSLFPHYLLSHSHDIRYSSPQVDILSDRLDKPGGGDKELYTPLLQ